MERDSYGLVKPHHPGHHGHEDPLVAEVEYFTQPPPMSLRSPVPSKYAPYKQQFDVSFVGEKYFMDALKFLRFDQFRILTSLYITQKIILVELCNYWKDTLTHKYLPCFVHIR